MVSLWNMDEVIYWDNTSAFVWNNIAALPTITEGEKVIDLLNCWVFAWLRACFRAYFLLLCIHSPSTAIANHWNRFCGSLSHSDLWCSWQGSYFRAHRNPEVEKEAIRIGLNHTHIRLQCETISLVDPSLYLWSSCNPSQHHSLWNCKNNSCCPQILPFIVLNRPSFFTIYTKCIQIHLYR